MTHENAFLSIPDYTLTSHNSDHGDGFLQDDGKYHTIMAAFILLHNYFSYLKEAGVYDNTRIILVADHGGVGANYPKNISLLDGRRLSSYNPLLMVKDFNSDAPDVVLNQSFEFMTNADAPLFAIDGIIDNPHNPETGAPLTPQKKDGAAIVTINQLGTRNHSKYTYTVHPYQWMYVHDDVFEAANWSH